MIFYKIQSMGNDFIVLFEQNIDTKEIKSLCEEHFGVGADGVLIIKSDKKYDALLNIYNKDGGKAKMCGNGLKIVAYFLKNILKNQKDEYHLLVNNNIEAVVGYEFNKYYALMDMPSFIGFIEPYSLYEIGNKHAIRIVDYISKTNLSNDKKNELFSQVNVTNLEMLDTNKFKILTYENGVGITKSCGSASLCAFKHLYDLGIINSKVEFVSLGGNYIIEKLMDKLCIFGDVKCVYKGEIMDGF